jgi:2C-methyl-D-erythritol 2,4-cyclodiphosphate synthase
MFKSSKINIKSTTAKGIGSIGSGEAIASHAVVSLFEGQNERGLG